MAMTDPNISWERTFPEPEPGTEQSNYACACPAPFETMKLSHWHFRLRVKPLADMRECFTFLCSCLEAPP